MGNVGATLALRHRVPWVLDVRDLWPDAAVAVGEMEPGRIYRMAARLERRLYRSAAAITATTEDFVRAIEARAGAGKVTLVRNGTQDLFLEIGLEPPDPERVGEADGRFTWTYAGNLGLAQGLEAAVEAAKLLGEGYRLILIGEGPRRLELARMANALPSGTAEVRDPIPPERAGRLLRASDALLVSLAPGFDGFVPSKLFDCCALARPVILAADGEAAQLAGQADAAVCVRPGNPAALAEAVRALRDDPARRDDLARHGREFAERNSRDLGVERLEGVLSEVVGAALRDRGTP